MADQDTNSMQDSLGLGRGSMAAEMGRPTPPIVLPPTKHPGQVSAELMAQSTQQAQITAQLARMSAPGTVGVAGGIYNPALGGFGGAPAMGMFNGGGMAMPMPGGFASQAIGAFGMQFSANQAAIAANRPSPFGMYGGMPLQGFNYGMMPQPAALTDPTLGIFRTQPTPANISPMYPAMPREPLFTAPPFIQPLPTPRFGTPFETGAAAAQVASAQMQGYALSGAGVATRGTVDFIGAGVGARLGAAAGSVFGPAGAALGSVAGTALGFFGADATFGRNAGTMMAEGPLATVAQRTAQVRGISNNFVVGGPDLNYTGRGLSAQSAVNMARAISDTGYSGATGFNPSDLTRVMNQGGRAGLFDAMQSAGDMRGQLVRVAQSLREFMQLANEPDVVSAVRQMGNLRTQGLSLGESTRAAQNARTFARMAGTNLAGISEAGQAGAYVAQQQGLTAGLGMQLGQAGRGLAQMAIAGGAFTPQQLALLGGASGIGQRQAEMGTAFLQVPMVAASAAQYGADGRFSLSASGVRRIGSGGIDIPGMALSATDNINRAVARGGVGALAQFMMQQPELQDQLGRQLGPIGTQMASIQQMAGIMRLTGQSGPQGAAMAALMMNPGNPDAARQMYGMATSRGFYRNAQRQLDVAEAEMGGAYTAARRSAIENNPASQSGYGIFRDMGGAIGVMAGKAGSLVDRASAFMSEVSEDSKAADQGLTISRMNSALLPQNEEEMSALRAYGIARGADLNPTARRNSLELVSENANDLFGNDGQGAVMDYIRERKGQGTTRKYFGRMLGKYAGGYDMNDPTVRAQLEAEARSYSNAAFMMTDVMKTDVNQTAEAESSLTKEYGADAVREMQRKFSSGLYQKAKGRTATGVSGAIASFFGQAGDESLQEQDIQDVQATIIADAVAAKGRTLTTQEEEELTKRVRQASGAHTQALLAATPAAANTDTGTGAFDKARMARASKEGIKRYEAAGNALFKPHNGFVDGTDEEHVRSLNKLFSKGQSAEEAALTSLYTVMANGTPDERDAAQQKIDELLKLDAAKAPKDRKLSTEVVRRAQAAAKTMGEDSGVQKVVQRTGLRGAETLSAADMVKEFDTARDATMQDKAVAQMLSTVEAIERTGLAGREDVVKAFKDKGTQGMLDAIKSKGGANYLKGSPAADVLRSLYEDYETAAATGDPLQQSAAMEKFANQASDYLPRSASAARSGEVVPGVGRTKADVAATSRMMSGSFTDAQTQFAGAVPAFAAGAQALFNAFANGGPRLPIPSGSNGPGQ